MTLPVVYLHGLFGSPADFDEMTRLIPGFSIALPGHEASLNRVNRETTSTQNNANRINVCEDVLTKIRSLTPCALIGYSMGGRIALQLQQLYPELFPKIICLGSHLGIQSEQERAQRKNWEDMWIEHLKKLSPEEVFEKWYAQPLFASFRSRPEYQEILKRRLQVDLEQIAVVFDSTRRSGMQAITPSQKQALFLVGEDDKNMLNHYREHLHKEQYFVIEKAGHCLHIENPITCSKILQSWLEGKDDLHRRTNESRMENCLYI